MTSTSDNVRAAFGNVQGKMSIKKCNRRLDGDEIFWRPVRESNPSRRRESDAIQCNSLKLSVMDSFLPHLKRLTGTLIGRVMDARMFSRRQSDYTLLLQFPPL